MALTSSVESHPHGLHITREWKHYYIKSGCVHFTKKFFKVPLPGINNIFTKGQNSLQLLPSWGTDSFARMFLGHPVPLLFCGISNLLPLSSFAFVTAFALVPLAFLYLSAESGGLYVSSTHKSSLFNSMTSPHYQYPQAYSRVAIINFFSDASMIEGVHLDSIPPIPLHTKKKPF